MLECKSWVNEHWTAKEELPRAWFQNARAKEKKSKLSMAKHFGINQTSYEDQNRVHFVWHQSTAPGCLYVTISFPNSISPKLKTPLKPAGQGERAL